MTKLPHFIGKYKHILYIYLISIFLFSLSIGTIEVISYMNWLIYTLSYIFTIGGLYVCIITCSIKY